MWEGGKWRRENVERSEVRRKELKEHGERGKGRERTVCGVDKNKFYTGQKNLCDDCVAVQKMPGKSGNNYESSSQSCSNLARLRIQ